MRNSAASISALVSCLILAVHPCSAQVQVQRGLQEPVSLIPGQGAVQRPLGAAAGPDLNIQVTHTSSFLRGQTNAVYLIRVTNVGGGATSGTIAVVESMPSGISIASMSGPGWTCAASTCSRTDSFAAGQMLPTITVLATVGANAPGSINNLVTVSGGGDSNISDNVATDATSIASEGWLYGQENGALPSVASLAPRTLSDAVAIAGSRLGGLALRKDGTVVQWVLDHSNNWPLPAGLKNVIAVAAGDTTFFALKSDGHVVAWSTSYPAPDTSSLSNIVSIVAGPNFALALSAEGTVQAVSLAMPAEVFIPAALSNVVQLSAGTGGAFVLTAQGKVVSWGGRVPPIPANLGTLVRVERVDLDTAAGIRADGTVVVWDKARTSELLTPPAGLNRVVALAGDSYVMALQDDGIVRAWGPSTSQVTPWPNVALAAGSLASARAIAGTPSFFLVILSAPPVILSVQVTAQHFDVKSYAVDSPKFAIDGIPATYYNAVRVAPGGTHTISTGQKQFSSGNGVEWNFASWSDGGAATHSIAIGSADAAYTLDFKPRVRLATSAGTGGTISPAGGYFDIGSSVLIQATPLPGFVFSKFTGGSLGTTGNNPARTVMNAPDQVTASFVAQTGTALRATLRGAGPFIQGQQNASFAGRVLNEGTTAVSGVSVTFTNVTIKSLWGTGWSCSGSTCSRADTLAAGQAFPAIQAVVSIPANTTSSIAPVMQVRSTNASIVEATAPTEVSGAGNAVLCWGDHAAGQCSLPNGLTNLTALAAGGRHTAALRGDGTVAAWGANDTQQSQVPFNLTSVIALAAGLDHTLALSSAGQVTAWGDNGSGQSSVPANLTNVLAIAAGAHHSLALTSSGSVAAWGANGSGQSSVPASVQNAVAIAAGGDHSLAVLGDGTVIAWGSNGAGESTVPANLAAVESVAAGTQFSLAALRNGTVAAWGNNPASIQAGIPANLQDVRQVAAGGAHALALQWNGTLQAWGANDKGQTTLPGSATQVAAVTAGLAHSAAITAVSPQAAVSFSTQPAGQAYAVDGVTYATAQTFHWSAGSTHTVEVAPIQPGATAGTRYVLQGWSDGGAATKRSFTLWESGTYSLTFKTQYLLTTTASAGGTIAPATGYLDSNYLVSITATPDGGYRFAGFSGDLTGSNGSQSLSMTAPRAVHAVFVPATPSADAVSVSPASGSGASGAFTATYSAGLGHTDLLFVQFLVAAAADGGGQPYCFLHYDVRGDGFWLYGDGGFFVGPVQPGTASAALQNKLCAINTQTSSVTGSGTTFTLNARPVFKTAATLNIYLRAYTTGDIDTGWVQRGTWTTAPTPIGNMGVQPASGSGAQQAFALTYQDPAGFAGAPAAWSQFLIAAATDGGGQPFCFVHYDHAGNSLWMYSSDVGFFLGPVSPGAASAALDSSACSVDPALTTIARPGEVVRVSVPVHLKAPMSGAKQMYMRMQDPLRRDSGWVAAGSWTIP
ncbi:InlB B-repeat-containing protein [Paludibaculum fermentans]|uniref:DUF11 domain-containing protein n=1 Tax=Paludibaculum fermentans TaxID=1473598 RepID=A0A7S7NQV1_PALFE|nr:DUF11 domain-containing protein [Paludibaculum fermentans]QOY88031.1 hypothetical protein IRI77_35735 [Paludibaculum fermentans]